MTDLDRAAIRAEHFPHKVTAGQRCSADRDPYPCRLIRLLEWGEQMERELSHLKINHRKQIESTADAAVKNMRLKKRLRAAESKRDEQCCWNDSRDRCSKRGDCPCSCHTADTVPLSRVERLERELQQARESYAGICRTLDESGKRRLAAESERDEWRARAEEVERERDEFVLSRSLLCGRTGARDGYAAAGCGDVIPNALEDGYRCLECGRWMHADCLRKHFIAYGDEVQVSTDIARANAAAAEKLLLAAEVRATAFGRALEHIKRVVGTSTESWHIANNALAAPDGQQGADAPVLAARAVDEVAIRAAIEADQPGADSAGEQ